MNKDFDIIVGNDRSIALQFDGYGLAKNFSSDDYKRVVLAAERQEAKIKELEERLSRSIELLPEDLNFLTELSAEMKSQDNCITASPHFFTVQTTEMKGAYDMNYTDDYGYVFPDEDYHVIMANEIDKMNEYIIDFDGEEHADFELEAMKVKDSDEFEEFLDKHEVNYFKSGYKEETQYENAFLTSKACREYIERDRHNLKAKPQCYCMYAQKNPELDNLIKILKKYFALHVNEDYEYMKREVQGRLNFLLSDRRNDKSWEETYYSISKSFLDGLKRFSKRNPSKHIFNYEDAKGRVEVITECETVTATFYPKVVLNKINISLTLNEDFKPLVDSIFINEDKEKQA